MFTMTKERCTADRKLWSHVSGWEVRLTCGATLLQSQTCVGLIRFRGLIDYVDPVSPSFVEESL